MDLPNTYPTPPPENYLSEIRRFLHGGGDPNHRDIFWETLLHAAAKVLDSYEVTKELISAGADVNLVNFLGQTPLHIAVIQRNRRVANVLIQYGALVNTKDCHGNSVLHSAIKACVDRHWNCTNLYCPHLFPDMHTIKKLLRHESVDVNVRNARGYTPLLIAIKDRNLEIVTALLAERGADVNIGNYLNETPLHAAVSYPNPSKEIAAALLFYGACIFCLDNNEHNPLDLVVEQVLNGVSSTFAEEFLKLVAFYNQNILQVSLSLQTHPPLLTHYINCTKEINRMRSEIVPGNISVYDFLYGRVSNRIIFQTETCKAIVSILISGGYPMYFEIVLGSMTKYELHNILIESARSCHYENITHRTLYTIIAALNTI